MNASIASSKPAHVQGLWLEYAVRMNRLLGEYGGRVGAVAMLARSVPEAAPAPVVPPQPFNGTGG